MSEQVSERQLRELISSRSLGGLVRRCMTLSQLEDAWRTIAGDALASRTAPAAVEGDVLIVLAESRASVMDLSFKKLSIMRRIKSELNIQLSDIKINIGSTKTSSRIASRAPRRQKSSCGPSDGSVCAIQQVIERDHSEMPGELARSIARCIAASREMDGRRIV